MLWLDTSDSSSMRAAITALPPPYDPDLLLAPPWISHIVLFLLVLLSRLLHSDVSSMFRQDSSRTRNTKSSLRNISDPEEDANWIFNMYEHNGILRKALRHCAEIYHHIIDTLHHTVWVLPTSGRKSSGKMLKLKNSETRCRETVHAFRL